jgi:uncharacterized protein
MPWSRLDSARLKHMGLSALVALVATASHSLMTNPATVIRLDPAACLAMLAQGSVGRVAITVGALPTIRIVRYILSDDDVVFRVARDPRLRRAANEAVVAFGADHCDDDARHGWSVVVQGRCRSVNDPEWLARLRTLPLMPWVDTPEGDVFMSIPLTGVTGETVSW